jgi:endonuclease YncB( thermonuclease family)
MKKTFFILAALAFTTAAAQAQQYRVIGVMDGDTVKVLSNDRQQIKCRLHGVDAPEKNQAYGQRSKDSLSEMVFQKVVDVAVVDQDQYGRSVCRISLNGVDINKVQLQRGMVWHYSRYSKDASYAQAEAAARQQRLGLWGDANPTPPWAFRRNERSANYR